jgi:hypothetical protein
LFVLSCLKWKRDLWGCAHSLFSQKKLSLSGLFVFSHCDKAQQFMSYSNIWLGVFFFLRFVYGIFWWLLFATICSLLTGGFSRFFKVIANTIKAFACQSFSKQFSSWMCLLVQFLLWLKKKKFLVVGISRRRVWGENVWKKLWKQKIATCLPATFMLLFFKYLMIVLFLWNCNFLWNLW